MRSNLKPKLNMRNHNLEEWLTAPATAAYFGRAFQVKADILAQILTGEPSLVDIAKRHEISLTAVYKHRAKALKIFQPKVERVDSIATLNK